MVELIQAERKDGYHIISLNRSEKLNAFTRPMHRALLEALEAADADTSCGAVLLTGRGRGFSVGQDLSEVDPTQEGAPHDLASVVAETYNPLIRFIRSCEMPIVCAVNGIAAGAGASLALACDLVIAARSARFIMAFAKIGLVPDSGATWTMSRLIGEQRALGLALTGAPLPAEQAESWGLIWRVADDDNLMAEAEELTATLGNGPRLGQALTKKAILGAATRSLDEQLDVEMDFQGRAGAHRDYVEGIRAFSEKRAPSFAKGSR